MQQWPGVRCTRGKDTTYSDGADGSQSRNHPVQTLTGPSLHSTHTAGNATGRWSGGGGGGVRAANPNKAVSPAYREGGSGSTPQASRAQRGN